MKQSTINAQSALRIVGTRHALRGTLNAMSEHERLCALIADAIECDLRDRRGIKREFEQCDPEVMDDIRETWRSIVSMAIHAAGR